MSNESSYCKEMNFNFPKKNLQNYTLDYYLRKSVITPEIEFDKFITVYCMLVCFSN